MEVELTKEYITSLIDKKGMTKAEFAKQVGVARQNLDVLLSSKKKDINTIIRMSEVLGISLTEFLYGKQGSIVISGFIKVNETIYEIKNKEDMVMILKEIEELEKSEK